MLSILIPTYNYNVLPLFEKIRAQAKSLTIDCEIIIFDDHSTQDFPAHEEINFFPNACYLKLEKNIGRSAIRIKLAEQAKYNSLLFLDADVLPVSDDFLENYISILETTKAAVIFGGVDYMKSKPAESERLRWKFGRKREVKLAAEREKTPYFVISPNLLMQKDCFLSLNTEVENYYGHDLVLSQKLKTSKKQVLHIDNPVYHLGLEPSDIFLEKAMSAVKNTVVLEKKGVLEPDFTKLQQSYLKLKKLGTIGVFRILISPFKKSMKRNLLSATPNLFYFDLYRLAYYIELKSEMND